MYPLLSIPQGFADLLLDLDRKSGQLSWMPHITCTKLLLLIFFYMMDPIKHQFDIIQKHGLQMAGLVTITSGGEFN